LLMAGGIKTGINLCDALTVRKKKLLCRFSFQSKPAPLHLGLNLRKQHFNWNDKAMKPTIKVTVQLGTHLSVNLPKTVTAARISWWSNSLTVNRQNDQHSTSEKGIKRDTELRSVYHKDGKPFVCRDLSLGSKIMYRGKSKQYNVIDM